MKPKRDWKILVIIFGILCVLIMAIDVYAVYRLYKGTLFSVPESVTDNEIASQKKALQEINGKFKQQAEEYAAFQIVKPVLSDPSI